MELDTNEPRVLRPFDNFGQLPVGRHTGEDQSCFLERIAIVDVDFVAMAMTLAYLVRAVKRAGTAVAVKLGGISAKTHRAAEISARRALLEALLAHPLSDHADNGFRRVTELCRRCLRNAGEVPRAFDARHLHAKTNTEEGDFAFARELDACDLAFAAALTEAARHEDAVQRFELGD